MGKKFANRARKYAVPRGRAQRNRAVLRRASSLRTWSTRWQQQCSECKQWRKLGGWWEDPDIRFAERRATYIWFCEPCSLKWWVARNTWYFEDWRARWDKAFGEDSVALESCSCSSLSSSSSSPLASSPKHFDFIEIGTSSYNTFTQAVAGHPNEKPFAWDYLPWGKHPLQIRGLAVDMNKDHLDQLPDVPCVSKQRMAISEKDGFARMFYVPLADIEHWEKVFARIGHGRAFSDVRLARGCSSLREHAMLRRRLKVHGLGHLIRVKRVRTCSVETLFRRHNVASVGVLALDCEGHDCVILRSLMRACDAGVSKWPEWIWFESNGLNDQHFGAGTESKTIQELERRGYTVWWGGSYKDTFMRDTVLRHCTAKR